MKKSTKMGFIYFRYIFPIIANIAMIGAMFVPAYRYVTADTGINKAISLWTLLGNSWTQVREYLFGGEKQELVVADFSWTVLITVILFVLLFVIGAVFSVYAAVSAFRYFGDDCRESQERTVFITIVPNRIVLCVYHALTLPIFFFPLLMPVIYEGILNYHVEISYPTFDMAIVAAVLYALIVAAVAISSGYETDTGKNIFIKRKPFTDEVQEEHEEIVERNPIHDPYEVMAEKSRQEQTERILRLLNKQTDNDMKEDDQ